MTAGVASTRVMLAIATNNANKVRELRALFATLPVEVISAREALGGGDFDVVEDGVTFAENAEKKARALADAAHCLAIADDSGLEVDALGGRPGVRSARFAHEHATDAENNAALLASLEGVPPAQRGARFRCALALIDPHGPHTTRAVLVEGACEGHIALTPRGASGFGYDPLFLVDARGGLAMAELADDDKNVVSHRGAAFRALLPTLQAAIVRRLARAEEAARSTAEVDRTAGSVRR